ncbi:hypothetical protein EPN15_03680 [Patescibacteria group bacterium]|nr:MAG: hypothetical protein EPN15_03680 [Patescibacteria group bacterium]
MKYKRVQFIALILAVIALAGLGCKKADNANININSALGDNKNIAVSGSNKNISNTNASIGGQANANTANPQQANAASRGKSDVEKIARFFTEFFGSFSTDSNYGNVTGLKIYMTQNMQKWADGFVADAKKNKNNAAGYFGVTTKAVSVKTDSFSEEQGKAEVTVSCQRREATGTSTNARIYYQDMTVSFLKEKGVWKVNEAKWK